jgi:hypothetical protein
MQRVRFDAGWVRPTLRSETVRDPTSPPRHYARDVPEIGAAARGDRLTAARMPRRYREHLLAASDLGENASEHSGGENNRIYQGPDARLQRRVFGAIESRCKISVGS